MIVNDDLEKMLLVAVGDCLSDSPGGLKQRKFHCHSEFDNSAVNVANIV
jgi:hypothetical protein